MSKRTVLLIDGDVFIYQIGLSVEKVIDWGDDLWVNYSDLKDAKEAFVTRTERLIADLGADEVRFALSCKTEEGFRRALCPTYKSNRANARKPLVHQAFRQWLLEEHDTILRDKLEADDILGILATQPTDERRIIVSIDKDFRTVPCEFYRTNTDSPVLETVTPFGAARFHAIQTLTGDRVDGYVGIPGVGPKTAEKFLEGITDAALLWPAVVKAYKEAGLSEAVALQNARLARILQHGDYDIKKGLIKLWTPLPQPPTPAATNPTSPSTSAATKTSPKVRSKKATS